MADRDEIVARLREIALSPPTLDELAAREAARTDPWRWYCRTCGAEGSVEDGEGAQGTRDKAAMAHLSEAHCGPDEIPGKVPRRLLHVWSYSGTARWD